MKFGKSISSQQEEDVDLHYLDYKGLKKCIKDVVQLSSQGDLAEALTANSRFDEALVKEINLVNACFSARQTELLDRTAALSENLLQGVAATGGPPSAASSSSGVNVPSGVATWVAANAAVRSITASSAASSVAPASSVNDGASGAAGGAGGRGIDLDDDNDDAASDRRNSGGGSRGDAASEAGPEGKGGSGGTSQFVRHGSSDGTLVASGSPRVVESASSVRRSAAFRLLVGILGEVDRLRKYAVWNAVAVVKILKKRRKLTSFGLEDLAAERAGWLARQSFFSGSDFAVLHAAVESLGHELVISELDATRHHPQAMLERESPQEKQQQQQQCPICLDTITDMVELSCAHRFCWKCFVLGPIAHQPGEYRIAQCPICRRETAGYSAEEVVKVPSTEGLLSRFLHTYFPQTPGGPEHDDQTLSEAARKEGERTEREVRDVVGELVRALLMEASEVAGNAKEETKRHLSTSAGSSRSFFNTLPPAPSAQQIGAAQKLQWLQLASTGDPLALDSGALCSLCSEPLIMEAIVTTPCKHHFHRICITRLDMPRCPLCDVDLPFAWFLPDDHPCAEQGFRVVSPGDYHPRFAGGPSKGSGAWPLAQPPPKCLYSAGGAMMKSYLHRAALTLGQEAETTRRPDSSGSRDEDSLDGDDEDDSSSDDSTSSMGNEGAVFAQDAPDATDAADDPEGEGDAADVGESSESRPSRAAPKPGHLAEAKEKRHAWSSLGRVRLMVCSEEVLERPAGRK